MELNCLNPDGAFYVFPSCKGLMGKKDTNGNEIKSDTDFVQSLLENSGNCCSSRFCIWFRMVF